eukprot:evm.model.scf_3444.1 EVM.evm.TU.scf_3444.1   scf_3444:5538-7190(-)
MKAEACVEAQRGTALLSDMDALEKSADENARRLELQLEDVKEEALHAEYCLAAVDAEVKQTQGEIVQLRQNGCEKAKKLEKLNEAVEALVANSRAQWTSSEAAAHDRQKQ